MWRNTATKPAFHPQTMKKHNEPLEEDYLSRLVQLVLKTKDEVLLARILREEMEKIKKEMRQKVLMQQVQFEEIGVMNQRGGNDMIATKDILFAENDEHYVALYVTVNGEVVPFYRHGRIGENEKLLIACGLIRIHRTYMVHHTQVKNVNLQTMKVTMKNGKVLPTSDKYIDRLEQFLHL